MNEKLDIDVKTLRPFTKFIYTIGELPTSYLVSMTYEEQLIWLCNYLTNTVIPTINNNAEAVKEVQDLVTQLQNYINNYFDNLDVQQEINNKLDEMALNGTLKALIGQYCDPILNAQTQEINEFKYLVNNTVEQFNVKLNALESGSPLTASSTSEMTDTTRVYVNTTDGHWYYYNGTQWVDGGTYQSTGINENSVTPEMTTFCHKNVSLNKLNLNVVTNNKYINYNGNEVDYASTSISDYISVKQGDIIKFPLCNASTQANCGGSYNTLKEAYITIGTAVTSVTDEIVTYTAQRDGYIRINIDNSKLSTAMIIINDTYPNEYVPYEEDYFTLDNNFKLNNSQLEQIGDITYTDILENKSLSTFGDSIVESRITSDGYNNGGAWPKFISNEYNMTLLNVASSGSTLSQYYNGSQLLKNKSIYWQLKEQLTGNYDYLIFDGGINDFGENKTLGEISSSYSSDISNYNLDTIIGGLEAICSTLVYSHQTSKYGFIFNHRYYKNDFERSNIGTYGNYVQKIIDVLEKWGIPYLNLTDEIPPINLLDNVMKITYTCNNDGLHPNELCYKRYYDDKIKSWLKSL